MPEIYDSNKMTDLLVFFSERVVKFSKIKKKYLVKLKFCHSENTCSILIFDKKTQFSIYNLFPKSKFSKIKKVLPCKIGILSF